jgi:D-glycero-D-manno-heptose 1,7-bisphosphate phosphatase
MDLAVFLDRDGTVCEEVGYVNHIDRLRLYPWSAGAIRKLNRAGIKAVVVTNQSGVARGLFPESLVHEVHEKLQRELAGAQAFLNGIYYCPHHPDGEVAAYRLRCECRKPHPGMIRRAVRELSLDSARSYVVGDKYVDLEMAFRAGARGILVLSGYGKGEWQYRRHNWARLPDYVAVDLSEAVDWILNQAGSHAMPGPG